jgi:hypothetical protein
MIDSEVKLRKPPIIILGTARSGTSMVANLVHRWGAYGGDPDQLSNGDDRNLHGYWENELFATFGGFFFRDVSARFWHPDFVDTITARAADPYWHDAALDIISMMGDQGRIWFWKQPEISVYLPFWKKIWGSATYLITVRNPYDSAVSWQKFRLPREAQSKICTVAAYLLRWQVIMMSALENTQDCNSKIFIPYEDLVNEPRKQCRRLCNFLSDEYLLERVDDDRLEFIARGVDPKSWRNRSSTPFTDVSIATEAQKALYQLLLEKVDDPNKPFDAAQYTIYPGWREYLENLQTIEALYD